MISFSFSKLDQAFMQITPIIFVFVIRGISAFISSFSFISLAYQFSP
jgi:hypothetical protein